MKRYALLLSFCLLFVLHAGLARAQTKKDASFPAWFWSLFTVKQEEAPQTGIAAIPAQSPEIKVVDRCNEYRPFIDQAKVEMEKKNNLEVNACQLYKNWAKLWEASECDATAYADAPSLTCHGRFLGVVDNPNEKARALLLKSCEEITRDYQTSMNWVQAGFQACDYSAFEVGCKSLAEAAQWCESRQCSENCKFRYDCNPESFKTLIHSIPNYFNDPPRLSQCMDQLRRAGL